MKYFLLRYNNYVCYKATMFLTQCYFDSQPWAFCNKNNEHINWKIGPPSQSALGAEKKWNIENELR